MATTLSAFFLIVSTIALLTLLHHTVPAQSLTINLNINIIIIIINSIVIIMNNVIFTSSTSPAGVH